MKEAAFSVDIPEPYWFQKACKIGYNQFKLPTSSEETVPTTITTTPIESSSAVVNLVATNMEKQNLVPALFEGFVPWGHFSTINGETKFVPGPVIEAMERGCTLLLDECDLGSNKLMCLQPVLEGKGVYLKKVNKWITPKLGFNVMATANTKGKGSEDGRFIGTNVLNEAFLERFAITIEQPYATAATEKKIIVGSMKKYGAIDEEFATNLVTWAEVIRKTFYDGGVDEVISTRRLDHIVKAFAIFKDKMKSIELCVARFDDDTKESFMDLYTKIDAGVDVSGEVSPESEYESAMLDDVNEPQF